MEHCFQTFIPAKWWWCPTQLVCFTKWMPSEFMTSTTVEQTWMNVSEGCVAVDEVNKAVFASSLAALPPPTGAGVGRGTHVIEHD